MEKEKDILQNLRKPGKKLLFVDDSEISGVNRPDVERNKMVYCGVDIVSDNYETVISIMSNNLPEEVDEYHATEIVNPNKKSQWYGVSFEERIECIKLLNGVLIKYCDWLPFCFIAERNYRNIISEYSNYREKQKKALRDVFTASLLKSDWSQNNEYIIVFDAERKLDKGCRIINDQIIEVSSKLEMGVQLADFAAYMITRREHIKYRCQNDAINKNEFDVIIAEIGLALWDRSDMLLNVDTQSE